MKQVKWIPFYHGDWLAGVAGLTAHETGVYIQLLMLMYEKGEPLAASNAYLARKCGTTPARFRAALEALTQAGKIICDDKGLWNLRAQEEMARRRLKSQTAKNSADQRWRGGNQTDAEKVENPKSQRSDPKDQRKPAQTLNPRDANAAKSQSPRDAILDSYKIPPLSPQSESGGQSEGGAAKQFEIFWALYPQRKGRNPKEPAARKFSKLSPHEQQAAQSGAKAYAAWCRRENQNPQYIPQAVTWLNQRGWEEENLCQEPQIDRELIASLTTTTSPGPTSDGRSAIR